MFEPLSVAFSGTHFPKLLRLEVLLINDCLRGVPVRRLESFRDFANFISPHSVLGVLMGLCGPTTKMAAPTLTPGVSRVLLLVIAELSAPVSGIRAVSGPTPRHGFPLTPHATASTVRSWISPAS